MSERLVVITGPSGAGKMPLALSIKERLGARSVVSCTTRAPQPGEVDGVDYRFFDRDDFLWRVFNKEFAECAWIHRNLYGTLREDIARAIDSSRIVVLVVGMESMKKVAGLYPGAQTFFVTAPFEQLVRRLSERPMDGTLRSECIKGLEEELLGSTSPCIRNVIHNDDGKFDVVVQQVCSIIQRNARHPIGRV